MGLLFLIAATLAVSAPKFNVERFDEGTSVSGPLTALNDQNAVVADAKLSDVRLIEAAPDSADHSRAPSSAESQKTKPATVVLETLDGSRLPGFAFEAAKGLGRLTLDSGQTIGVPTKFIHRVEFRPEGKPAVWPELPADVAGDLIVVQKKDAADLVEGVIGDVTADTVKFSVEGDVVPVKRTKVIGLVYFHSPQASQPEQTKVIVDASADWRVHGTHVALVGGNIEVTTTFGAKLSRPLDSIERIDFSASRMDCLSDLPVDNVEWTPLLDFGKPGEALSQLYKPRFDRTFGGGQLGIGEHKFRKGVAMAARTVLEYKIAGRGRRFCATAWIDESVHGSVLLSIEGDGKNLYRGKIASGDKPVDLNLDVASVKRLRIVADFGGGAGVGDYLDLGDARIVK